MSAYIDLPQTEKDELADWALYVKNNLKAAVVANGGGITDDKDVIDVLLLGSFLYGTAQPLDTIDSNQSDYDIGIIFPILMAAGPQGSIYTGNRGSFSRAYTHIAVRSQHTLFNLARVAQGKAMHYNALRDFSLFPAPLTDNPTGMSLITGAVFQTPQEFADNHDLSWGE